MIVWYDADMRKLLRETNPAEKWLEERFKVQINAANGGVIQVRFDLKSSGDKGFRFNEERVIEHFGHMILADKETDYGEYLNVASIIAGMLNEQIDAQAEAALKHARISLLLLDALDAGRPDLARGLMLDLLAELDYFGTHADKVWAVWTNLVVDHLNMEKPLGD